MADHEVERDSRRMTHHSTATEGCPVERLLPSDSPLSAPA